MEEECVSEINVCDLGTVSRCSSIARELSC